MVSQLWFSEARLRLAFLIYRDWFVSMGLVISDLYKFTFIGPLNLLWGRALITTCLEFSNYLGVIMGYSTLDSWHLSRLLCVFPIYLFWMSFFVNLNVGPLKYLSFFVDSQRVFQYIWFILRWSHVPRFFTPSSILSEIIEHTQGLVTFPHNWCLFLLLSRFSTSQCTVSTLYKQSFNPMLV